MHDDPSFLISFVVLARPSRSSWCSIDVQTSRTISLHLRLRKSLFYVPQYYHEPNHPIFRIGEQSLPSLFPSLQTSPALSTLSTPRSKSAVPSIYSTSLGYSAYVFPPVTNLFLYLLTHDFFLYWNILVLFSLWGILYLIYALPSERNLLGSCHTRRRWIRTYNWSWRSVFARRERKCRSWSQVMEVIELVFTGTSSWPSSFVGSVLRSVPSSPTKIHPLNTSIACAYYPDIDFIPSFMC